MCACIRVALLLVSENRGWHLPNRGCQPLWWGCLRCHLHNRCGSAARCTRRGDEAHLREEVASLELPKVLITSNLCRCIALEGLRARDGDGEKVGTAWFNARHTTFKPRHGQGINQGCTGYHTSNIKLKVHVLMPWQRRSRSRRRDGRRRTGCAHCPGCCRRPAHVAALHTHTKVSMNV